MKEKIVSVKYNFVPDISIRVIDVSDDNFLTAHKKKYPFYLNNNVTFDIETSKRKFSFLIPEGFVWNGADIPKIFFFIGQSKDNNYLVASMVHDYLLDYRYYVQNDILKKEISMKELRRLTSLIFREILKNQKTNTIKANIMAGAVDIFQMTVCCKNWREKK